MTIEEWAKDFKSYVNALQMPRDDYKGIMSYINDALALLKEQEAVERTYRTGINGFSIIWTCGACGSDLHPNNAKAKYCSNCGKHVLWEGR